MTKWFTFFVSTESKDLLTVPVKKTTALTEVRYNIFKFNIILNYCESLYWQNHKLFQETIDFLGYSNSEKARAFKMAMSLMFTPTRRQVRSLMYSVIPQYHNIIM